MALFSMIGAALGASTVVAAGATVSAATAVGVGATALAAGTVGYSMYSSDQQMKAAKSAASARDQAQMPAAPVAPKIDDAAAIAQQKLSERQRSAARNESVMTNPLGLKDEATVARKKLLGG